MIGLKKGLPEYFRQNILNNCTGPLCRIFADFLFLFAYFIEKAIQRFFGNEYIEFGIHGFHAQRFSRGIVG